MEAAVSSRSARWVHIWIRMPPEVMLAALQQSSVDLASDSALKIADSFASVHDVGDMHAVWKVGTAYVKAMIPASAAATREHVTLKALQDQDLTFATPTVLFYGEWDGRYYLVVSQVPGSTLTDAWPSLNQTSRNKCVSEVVRICKEITPAFGEREQIAGIDGGHLPEYFLGRRFGKAWTWDFRPELLPQYCLEMKMDCTSLVFCHCDPGPTNILVHMEAGDPVVGIIDWECAGFVPKDWVRTKYLVSGGMDFEFPAGSSRAARRDWRDRMEARLGEEGFNEALDSWQAWFDTGRSR